MARKKREMGAFTNNLANAIILIISITINVILITVFNLSDEEFIIFPFNALMIGFVIVFFPLFFLFVRRENIKIKKHIENSNKTEIQSLKELPLKYDIYRKLTHLVALGVIFFYFTLGFLIQNVFVDLLEFIPGFISRIFQIGGDIMIFTQNLVVFLVGISLIGLLTADIVRILAPKIYPLKQVNQILREKELHLRLGPHISMGIGCFSIILLYGLIQPIGPVLICTSMAMSIFGDTSSNLVGRMIGRRKIRKINKTYEGLVAGIIVSFFSGISVLYLLRNFYSFNILGLLLIPFIGAMIIGLLDYIDLEIDDNLSFNFCLSTIFFTISVSFF
ncbi:MAG: hypothetical protein CEE43_08210 [Promethearchaeota archaeon Loki_b32]|nr:MAG: hypothetical protein CEE43_08210 [Candidatus Lokiarchaeota archaeon Loki_b32]